MDFETITFVKADGIATITLNRPEKLNALGGKMDDELMLAWDESDRSDDVKVVVMTGAGRAFCSGADIKERLAGKARALKEGHIGELESSFAVTGPMKLRSIRKPVIAAVNGFAIGFGASLTLACDIRIASENATFSFAFARMGLFPEFGSSYYLPRLVGLGQAFELLYTARTFTAAEAKEIGLVNRVVPAAELMKQTYELAAAIAGGPPISIQLMKRGVYQSLNQTMEQQLEVENFSLNLCRRTEDHQEAIRAFTERRKPVFKGM